MHLRTCTCTGCTCVSLKASLWKNKHLKATFELLYLLPTRLFDFSFVIVKKPSGNGWWLSKPGDRVTGVSSMAEQSGYEVFH